MNWLETMVLMLCLAAMMLALALAGCSDRETPTSPSGTQLAAPLLDSLQILEEENRRLTILLGNTRCILDCYKQRYGTIDSCNCGI